MFNRKNFEGLVIFALAIVLVVSFVAISAYTAGDKQAEITAFPKGEGIRGSGGITAKGVVWDNGMQYDNGLSAQIDATQPIVSEPADDFEFATDQIVNDVHWIGGYWMGPPDDGDFDWRVTFYSDFGDGTKPGAQIASYDFPNANVNETWIAGTPGNPNYYSYSVNLPATLSFLAGTKYWISIQGIGDVPPRSMWAMHSDQILLHEAVFRSAYFGYPDWTDVSTVVGAPHDMCFQLTYEETWPNHKMHFPQLPDLEGWDVYAVYPKTLADDWQCTETGEVLDIHFWGSWRNLDGIPETDEYQTEMPYFQLSIHRNIPADPDTPWSRPGELIWFWEGEILGTPFEPPALEHWYNPNTGEVIYNDHVPYWRYDFIFDEADPVPEPFYQYEDSIYWLNISVRYIDPPYEWGWKSSRDHFMDDAVYTDYPPDGPWNEMYEPPRYNEFSVTFGSDGTPTEWYGTNYYGEGFYGYEYWWNMWFYDNPFTYDHDKIGTIQFSVDPIGPAPYLEFAINWSTDIWFYEGVPGRPPLPGEDETLFIGRQVIGYLDPYGGPYTFPIEIYDYNPEWISVDFVATDVVITGETYHECEGTSLDLAFVITGEEAPTGRNHYKTWWIESETFSEFVFVQDQFMEDDLELTAKWLLSNPVKKVVEIDTFDIISPNDHLTWYKAFGRDTLIQVEYENQFESATVEIGPVEYLLVPTGKFPHGDPVGLDHYKAYSIYDATEFPVQVELEDQFDIEYGSPEYIEYLRPAYFLTPAIKNMEQPQLFDSVTHYVAYEIYPTRYFSPEVYTWDQFGTDTLYVMESYMLLVPSIKRVLEPCDPPTIGCPADEIQDANGVYTTTTQWSADDGNPTDPSIILTSVVVDVSRLPAGISAANVNVDPPGLPAKTATGTVTYTVSDHCRSGGTIYLIATNNCIPALADTCSFDVTLTNDPPVIGQPDYLEYYVGDVVQYDITGNDPNGDVINDAASIQVEPDCGVYSITRTAGSGTSSGTWQVTWDTDGCIAGITYLVIHDLTDICGATSYCTTEVHLSQEEGWYWKSPYENYAPHGMPDFDQKQDNWVNPWGGQFSFCGPSAVANCFMWFDSKYEYNLGVPGDAMDNFPLVRDYMDALPPFTASQDDHDMWNVDHIGTPWFPGAPPPATSQLFYPGPQVPGGGLVPWGELIERLAYFFDTDGLASGIPDTGTNVMDMQAGIDAWFQSEMFPDSSTLADSLCEVTTKQPTFAYVESLIEKCEDVILLLGFWFWDETVPGEQQFIRGDINGDGMVGTTDITACVTGPSFMCDDAADVNDDGVFDQADCDYLTDMLFSGGPDPPPPYPDCGLDPTPDGLGCADFPPCPSVGGWARCGGHYVTCAGVNSQTRQIAFSDPFFDNAEAGGAGNVGDGWYIGHTHGAHGATVHNDAGNVSHDIYNVREDPITPAGLWEIVDYPLVSAPYWCYDFHGANTPDEYKEMTRPWNEVSEVFVEVEYCVHISPWDYRGDVNVPGGDGEVSVDDVVFLIAYLFRGGPAPWSFVEGDANCDGEVEVGDIVVLISYLFRYGPIPRCCDP